MIKSRYSVAELLQFQLACLPKSRQGLEVLVVRENWAYAEVKSKGGRGGVRREYQPTGEVMSAIKQVLLARALNQSMPQSAPVSVAAVIPSDVPPCVSVPSPSSTMTVATQAGALKDWQKTTAEARVALLREVERIAAIVGREKAITKLVIMAQDGTLPDRLARLVPLANARSGKDGKRTLSRRTVYEWLKAYQPGEVNALAPKDQHAMQRIPSWAGDLLAEYQRPQNPSLAWAVEQIAVKHGLDEQTLYHRARRFIQKMGNVELQAGRMGSREIKNIKPFIRRDSGMLWPADVYTADGHTFDSEVAHPVHGKPFRPEITSVVDVATRKIVGWSVDLAESGLAVLDAIRHACETCSIMTTFYVDNGSGYKNALMSAPGVGMEARLGFTMTHSIAYNSQARGIIERTHRSVWVRAAKELMTYIGADMDAQAKQKVHKLTRRDIALTSRSKYLMPFNDFIRFCEAQVERFNTRPHRSLPMTYDAALGRKRNMTPDEAWADGIKEGAQLVTITQEEARELFRPQREAKVLRGEIKLFGNQYFAAELTEYHGDVVRVAYDIHNADDVWVYDQQGRFICSAGFEANKRAYFPEAFLEQAARKRAEGRERRLQTKLDEVRLEQEGVPLTIENDPQPTFSIVGKHISREEVIVNLDNTIPAVYPMAEIKPAAPENEQPAATRPIFLLDSERYEWLMQHKQCWSDADHRFLTEYVNDPQGYSMLEERFALLGMAWNYSGQEFFRAAV